MADRYCSNCASNIFELVTLTDIMNYRGSKYKIEYNAMQCASCKEAFLTGEQSQIVSSKLVNSWRKDNDLLSSQELQRIRNKINYSKAKLGRLLKKDENTISRWEKDLSAQDFAVDRDYRVLDLVDEDPDLVKKFFPDIDLSSVSNEYELITIDIEIKRSVELQYREIIYEYSDSLVIDFTNWERLMDDSIENDLSSCNDSEVQRVAISRFGYSGVQLAA